MGVQVHPLPTRRDRITSFHNIYDQSERRKQRVTDVQESISLADFPSFPHTILNDATVLVAPVVGEVDLDLYPVLAQNTALAVTPQGYFRHIDSDGSVTQTRWTGFQDSLKHVVATVFSEEDIALASGRPDEKLLSEIVRACPLVAFTLGSKGAAIYTGGTATQVGSFFLHAGEATDSTGAGDTFAAVLVTELARGVRPKDAAVAAAFFAALKIRGVARGEGVDTIPTLNEIREFSEANRERVRKFLEQEDVAHVSFFELEAG